MNIAGRGGRPVLLLHEMPGQTPGALMLAQELAARGCCVYVPRLFGTYGMNCNLKGGLHTLVSRRWTPFRAGDAGPIRQDVRALLHWVSEQHPGQGIAVIGNCLTGALPVELLAEPCVETAVVCQPALPFFSWPAGRKTKLGLPEDAVERGIQSLAGKSRKQLICFNYEGDRFAPVERVQCLTEKAAATAGAHRVTLYLADQKTPCNSLPTWYQPVRTSTSRGHSTVTGAECTGCDGRAKPESDLWKFRQLLYQSLGLPAEPQARGKGASSR